MAFSTHLGVNVPHSFTQPQPALEKEKGTQMEVESTAAGTTTSDSSSPRRKRTAGNDPAIAAVEVDNALANDIKRLAGCDVQDLMKPFKVFMG